VWLWLLGERGELSSKSDAQDRVSEWADLGITDVVYSLNRIENYEEVTPPSEYGNYEEDSTNLRRVRHLCQSCAEQGIDVHLMIFLVPETTLIKSWAKVARRLEQTFSIRSIQLDTEGWWIGEGEEACRKGAQEVRTHFCEKLSCDVGSTSLASCPENLEPLLEGVDYGVPQMYATEENYGSTLKQMKQRMKSHYRAYLVGLEGVGSETELENLKQYAKRVVVGMAAYDDGLGPQSDEERMRMVLDAAFTLGGTGEGSVPPVREIAFWSSAGLQGGDRESFVRQICRLANQDNLTPKEFQRVQSEPA
jgi:hypothetical protein